MATQFILNGTLLNDEPKNWDDAAIKIVRDNTLKGLFIQYIADLEFVGDGYTIIANQINDLDCTDIRFEAVNTSSGFYFDGVINIKDATIYPEECRVKVNIEDASPLRQLLNYKNVSVQIGGGKTINGNALADVSTSINVPPWSATPSRDFIQIADLIQYIVDYFELPITVASTFFIGSDIQPRHIRYTLTGSDPGGNTFDVVVTNLFGEQYRYIITTFGSGAAGDIGAIYDHVIRDGLYTPMDDGYGEVPFAFIEDSPHFHIYDWSNVVDLVIENNTSGWTFTKAVDDPFIDSGAQIYLSFGAWMNDLAKTPTIKLGDIIAHLNKFFDIEMYYTKAGDQITLHIERTPDIYSSSQINVISDAIISSVKPSSIYNFNNYNYKNGFKGAYSRYMDELGYISDLCESDNLDIESQWWFGREALQEYAQMKEDTILVVDADGAAVHGWDHVTGRLVTFAPSPDLIEPSASLNSNLVIWRHLMMTDKTATIAGHTITPVGSISITHEIKVKYPISCEEINGIMASPLGNYVVTVSGESYTGWIKELSYKPVTGVAELTLYARRDVS